MMDSFPIITWKLYFSSPQLFIFYTHFILWFFCHSFFNLFFWNNQYYISIVCSMLRVEIKPLLLRSHWYWKEEIKAVDIIISLLYWQAMLTINSYVSKNKENTFEIFLLHLFIIGLISCMFDQKYCRPRLVKFAI